IDLLIAPGNIEPENGDSVPVDRDRIDLAVVIVARDHLAARRKTCDGAVEIAIILLELQAISSSAPWPRVEKVVVLVHAAHEAIARLAAAAPDFQMVPAREVALLVISKPGDVYVGA